MTKQLPLDGTGLVWVMLHPEEEYSWRAPWEIEELDLIEQEINWKSSIILNKSEQRKLRKLRQVWDSGNGRFVEMVPEIAIRHARLHLALTWLEGYLLNKTFQPSDKLEARARLMWSQEKMVVNRILALSREWPKFNWHLEDISAAYIPAFIRAYRRRVGLEAIDIFSGPHILNDHQLLWRIPERERSPKLVKRLELAKFEPVLNL